MERASCSINDPRPLWVSPAFAYSSADFAELGRKLRVVGRNLDSAGPGATRIQLKGPQTYVLATQGAPAGSAEQQYVAEAPLPEYIAPGRYSVAVSNDGRKWKRVANFRSYSAFTVRRAPWLLCGR